MGTPEFGAARRDAVVERRGVVGRHRSLVVCAVVVDEAHPLDGVVGVVELAQDLQDVVGNGPIDYHLADDAPALRVFVETEQVAQFLSRHTATLLVGPPPHPFKHRVADLGNREKTAHTPSGHNLFADDVAWAKGSSSLRRHLAWLALWWDNAGSPDKSGGEFFNSIENLYLCTMNNQGLLALAQLILPSEILSNFEVVRVEEEASLIRIYLDESVKAEYKENPEIESKGFCEAVTIRDFPIRDKGVDLIVRRRKWYDKQNNRYFSDFYDLKAEETRYSKEFAAFLKGVYGDDSYDLPFA